MSKIVYKLILNGQIQDEHRTIVGNFLKKQKKVIGDSYLKADRCKYICIAFSDKIPIAMGAIKPKTLSDFGKEKANLPKKSKEFDWELGYIYTENEFTRKGIARNIVTMLLKEYGEDNVMASTEIVDNPGMVKILKTFGFEHFGSLWKSDIHSNILGLFLRHINKR